MRVKFIISAAVCLFSASLAAQAMACTPSEHPPADRKIARSAYRSAAAVVDVEVIDLGGSDWNGWVTVRPLTVWKGHRQTSYKLTVQSSCDIGSEGFERGGRYRLLLQNGAGGYHADMGDNGLLGRDGLAFNAEVDRMLGQRRPANFKRCACGPPPLAARKRPS
jgi:hypothetical protein